MDGAPVEVPSAGRPGSGKAVTFKPFKALGQVNAAPELMSVHWLCHIEQRLELHSQTACTATDGGTAMCWSPVVMNAQVANAIVRTAGSAIALVEDAELRKCVGRFTRCVPRHLLPIMFVLQQRKTGMSLMLQFDLQESERHGHRAS